MTSKHYKAIAGAIRKEWGEIELTTQEYSNQYDAGEAVLANTMHRLADTLEQLDRKKFPHKFDRKRFLADCEPEHVHDPDDQNWNG